MKRIVSEIIIPIHDESCGILSATQVKIRLDDQGAGPYLCIEGIDMDPEEGGSEHQFYLCSIDEINQFAAICRKMLREAEC